MESRSWLLTLGVAVAVSAVLAGGSLAKQPGEAGPPDDEEFEDLTLHPLPPGMSERVFIHLPRTFKPGHLGTCTDTIDDATNEYVLGGWRLPNGGITWKINPSTVPSSVGAAAAHTAIASAFATWTAEDPQKVFIDGGNTSVTRSRLDFVNAIVWGRVPAGSIAVTHVRYYTDTGIVADVDTVFNVRYPWAVFPDGPECQLSPDAYDVENIAVHEFGHWIGHGDLYTLTSKDLTMYGYGAGGELKKRTLGTGDISGANAVAP